jgi:hypothetical protein
MQQAKNFYLLPFYFFLLGGLLSCGRLPQSAMNAINIRPRVDVTNIRDIQPRDNESTVYLQGEVTKQVPLLEHRVYQLQDATGTIWVLTNQTGLQPQDKLLIKGNVRYQSIPLAGKDFGEVYVEEQQRLERTPAH